MNEDITKIVELEIDLDNIELDDMGVHIVSFVEEAAIEVDFMAFAKEEYEGSYNPSALTPYVDQGDDLRERDHTDYILNDEEQKVYLEWAAECGELVTENYTYINANQEFSTIGDIAKAITGLDILGKMGIKQDEPADIKYKYTGNITTNSRNFCRALIGLNKMYSEGDFRNLRGRLSAINPGMGKNGQNSYNVFAYKGGVSCQHWWSKVALYKPVGSTKVLMMDMGEAEGDAGKSNNEDIQSPSGYVYNNASISRTFGFSTIDEDKRIVAGPLMIPNQFIIRREENGDPYYVFFSKDTIKRIQERFNKNGYQNVTDTNHDGEIKTNNILLEQWIIESREHDKSKFYGFNNLPAGTWFGVYRVNDDQTWKDIKSGKIKGFSIAGDFINKAESVKNQPEETLSKIIDVLQNLKD